METQTDKAVIREYIIQELPLIIEEEPRVRQSLIKIFRNSFADRNVTEDRFERLFKELKEDREENRKKWEEQNKKWEESNRRLDEQNRRWEDKFEAMMLEIKSLRNDYTSSIGALGARWGIAAESSFRDALKDILESHFDVRVINVNEYDDEGTVFGHPDQVELDLIIKDGELIICEIKSSMSKSEIYTFERKVRFYETRHSRKADRLIIISPMVRENARAIAAKLGISVFTYTEEVRL